MMRSMLITAIAVATLVAGCVPAEEVPAEHPLVTSAKEKVRDAMKDPESVVFQGVEVVDLMTPAGTAPIVCGEFNAKNGYGGYVGFERFTWIPDSGVMIASAYPRTRTRLMALSIETYCSGKVPLPTTASW